MTTDLEKNEGQKTVVSFAVGLLVGGLLVWAFSGSSETTSTPVVENDESTQMQSDEASMEESVSDSEDMATEEPADPVQEMITGDASVRIGAISAGSVVDLEGAVFPSDEGWVGVRTYTGGTVGSILGVSRYSKEQSLIPAQIDLLVPMVQGRDYAVVFFAENGDLEFNPAQDAQLDVEVTAFTAK